jgi:hypothetical protein
MKANADTTKFIIPHAPDANVPLSPFNRSRDRSYSSFSTAPLALEFNIPPGKSLADYFWIPMAKNDPLFDAFVIEFKHARTISAVVWILQMTLNQKHAGSSEGYRLIRMIKTKVKEDMQTQKDQERYNVTSKVCASEPGRGRMDAAKRLGVVQRKCLLSVCQ